MAKPISSMFIAGSPLAIKHDEWAWPTSEP